eukprot:tig00001239_g7762.t1
MAGLGSVVSAGRSLSWDLKALAFSVLRLSIRITATLPAAAFTAPAPVPPYGSGYVVAGTASLKTIGHSEFPGGSGAGGGGLWVTFIPPGLTAGSAFWDRDWYFLETWEMPTSGTTLGASDLDKKQWRSGLYDNSLAGPGGTGPSMWEASFDARGKILDTDSGLSGATSGYWGAAAGTRILTFKPRTMADMGVTYPTANPSRNYWVQSPPIHVPITGPSCLAARVKYGAFNETKAKFFVGLKFSWDVDSPGYRPWDIVRGIGTPTAACPVVVWGPSNSQNTHFAGTDFADSSCMLLKPLDLATWGTWQTHYVTFQGWSPYVRIYIVADFGDSFNSGFGGDNEPLASAANVYFSVDDVGIAAGACDAGLASLALAAPEARFPSRGSPLFDEKFASYTADAALGVGLGPSPGFPTFPGLYTIPSISFGFGLNMATASYRRALLQATAATPFMLSGPVVVSFGPGFNTSRGTIVQKAGPTVADAPSLQLTLATPEGFVGRGAQALALSAPPAIVQPASYWASISTPLEFYEVSDTQSEVAPRAVKRAEGGRFRVAPAGNPAPPASAARSCSMSGVPFALVAAAVPGNASAFDCRAPRWPGPLSVEAGLLVAFTSSAWPARAFSRVARNPTLEGGPALLSLAPGAAVLPATGSLTLEARGRPSPLRFERPASHLAPPQVALMSGKALPPGTTLRCRVGLSDASAAIAGSGNLAGGAVLYKVQCPLTQAAAPAGFSGGLNVSLLLTEAGGASSLTEPLVFSALPAAPAAALARGAVQSYLPAAEAEPHRANWTASLALAPHDALLAVGDKLWLVASDRTAMWDPATGVYISMATHSGLRDQRSHAAAAVLGEKVYVFGGLKENGVGTSLLSALDTTTWKWAEEAANDTDPAVAPAPFRQRRLRCLAAMAALGGKLYVTGGIVRVFSEVGYSDTVIHYADTIVYDLATKRWAQGPALPPGYYAQGLFGHRMVAVEAGAGYSLVLFGGMAKDPAIATPLKGPALALTALYTAGAGAYAWAAGPAQGPPARAFFGMAARGTDVFVYGGYDPASPSALLSDAWVLRSQGGTAIWSRLTVSGLPGATAALLQSFPLSLDDAVKEVYANVTAPLFGASIAAAGGVFFVVGGTEAAVNMTAQPNITPTVSSPLYSKSYPSWPIAALWVPPSEALVPPSPVVRIAEARPIAVGAGALAYPSLSVSSSPDVYAFGAGASLPNENGTVYPSAPAALAANQSVSQGTLRLRALLPNPALALVRFDLDMKGRDAQAAAAGGFVYIPFGSVGELGSPDFRVMEDFVAYDLRARAPLAFAFHARLSWSRSQLSATRYSIGVPPNGPVARARAAVAGSGTNPGPARLWMYGGTTGEDPGDYLNDFWVFVAGNEPALAPPPADAGGADLTCGRRGASLLPWPSAADGRLRLVLYGGHDGCLGPRGDVLLYDVDANTWEVIIDKNDYCHRARTSTAQRNERSRRPAKRPLSLSTLTGALALTMPAPSLRPTGCMRTNTARRLFVFGGANEAVTPATFLGDTWAFDLALREWVELDTDVNGSISASPPARAGASSFLLFPNASSAAAAAADADAAAPLWIVSGGYDQGGLLQADSFFVLCLRGASHWVNASGGEPRGEWLEKRGGGNLRPASRSTAVAVSSDLVLLFGGRGLDGYFAEPQSAIVDGAWIRTLPIVPRHIAGVQDCQPLPALSP